MQSSVLAPSTSKAPRVSVASERGFEAWIGLISACPWPAHAGIHMVTLPREPAPLARRPLYTAEERDRRDRTGWTLVQAVLAPLQFAVFVVSLVLVLRYFATGEGAAAAGVSVLIKTGLLYTIMITGSAWEKAVFGRWLFAPAFFWEDVFSMLVLALHTAYLGAVLLEMGSPREQLWLALAAYAAYLVNAGQFLLKLRMARLEAPVRASAAT